MASHPHLRDGFDPEGFCKTLAANVENDRLSDTEFRDFVRNSVPSLEELRAASEKRRAARR